jgi:hypothetical protein
MSHSTVSQIQHAGRCLNNFVILFENIYGNHHLVNNFHNLLHISDDCINYQGSLDSFSCFPFENYNYLGQIKKSVRSSRKPLAHLNKRIVEREQHQASQWFVRNNGPNESC